MNRAELSSISSSTILIDAKLGEQRMRQAKQCPNCGHTLERKPDWVGLPAGVKFDPTDQELIEHLEGKVKSESRSHPLIDEFIPTIEGDDGICYTHPEKLPGVTRDGLSRHFFHRPSKAYTTGTRKRRKIQTECHFQGGETRWHKTGKTRPVMANGSQKGCKKILVLYTNFGKNRKAEKTNWVMHQYHLGQLEEEREGELVVSKIFYQTQPRQCNLGERVTAAENIGKRESGKAAMLQREEMASVGAMLSRYGSLELPQLKGEHFGFSPFRRSFDEGGMDEAASPRPRETSAHTCKDGDDEERRRQVTQEQHCQATASAASFHVSRPCNVILSPAPLHHPPLVLDDPYSVSRLLLPPDKFQQQHKLLDRSTSGLEDLIMSCTRTDIKGEISISTSQETTEWLKNSYWPYPDNPDQHS